MLTAIAGTRVGRQRGVAVLPLRGYGHTAYMDAPAHVAERIRTVLGV